MYGCLIILFLGVFFVFFSLLSGIWRVLYTVWQMRREVKKTMQGLSQAGESGGFASSGRQSSSDSSTGSKKKSGPDGKFFGRNEGEYVDFEEV